MRAGIFNLKYKTMHLLEFQDYEVRVSPEALLVKPIRMLYNQDRSKQKEKFFQQMSYLYFMVDPRSTYAYISDPEERREAIIEQEGLDKDFRASELLEAAMAIYEKHTITSSTKLLESTRIAVDALSEELRKTQERLQERTDKGAAVYKINDIMGSLDKVLAFIPRLQELERRVESEIKDNTKARGGQKAMFEDGVDSFMSK